MNRKRERIPRVVVFLFLTALIGLITARMMMKSNEVRGEKVLDEQFRYFEKLTYKSQKNPATREKKELEREILSLLGSSFALPEEGFTYLSLHRVKTRSVKGAFVPFYYQRNLYLLCVYSLGGKSASARKDFLDAATLLSGMKEEVSFVVFETGENLKVSLMSAVSKEDLFLLTRNYFMER
ncbi:MAG: hypothetical protein GTN70_07700 [Deltaproteobacteria bacterium]|nr:hypothetical protein [Deltaproteobacteria bacterium]NIS77580.1 hypothetical protein [Deltaproteobacteria bacterium]